MKLIEWGLYKNCYVVCFRAKLIKIWDLAKSTISVALNQCWKQNYRQQK